MKTKIVLLTIIVFGFCSAKAQYYYSTNTAHETIERAIEVNSDVIKARTLDFEKKAESKPLMFVNTKKKISELNRVSNNLSYYLEALQKEVDKERVLSGLIEEHFYENLLFDAYGKLNEKGEKLKVKIDSLYLVSNKVNIHGLTGLTDFSSEHFNTHKNYYDDYENKIDYFKHLFCDRSNYGMMMAMYCLLLDVKTFELLYFQTIMSF